MRTWVRMRRYLLDCPVGLLTIFRRVIKRGETTWTRRRRRKRRSNSSRKSLRTPTQRYYSSRLPLIVGAKGNYYRNKLGDVARV